MSTFKYFALLFSAIMLFSACGDLTAKEIARVSASKPGDIAPRAAYVQLKKGDKIAIWSDMDFEYQSTPEMDFKVELYLNDALYETLEFKPTQKNMTINEVKSTTGKRKTWSFSGKNEEIEIRESGRFKCIAYLRTGFSVGLRINRADIVLKRKK